MEIISGIIITFFLILFAVFVPSIGGVMLAIWFGGLLFYWIFGMDSKHLRGPDEPLF